MALFSQRKGFKPMFKEPQVNNLDQETRNQIWTALKIYVFGHWNGSSYDDRSMKVEHLYQVIWIHLFKLPIDSVPSFDPNYPQSCYKVLRQLILERKWHEALDLVEFVIKMAPDAWSTSLTEALNHIFERENVGYRIVGQEIAEITDPIETESINAALSGPRTSIKEHLGRALELLSDRKSPDYRNSIKESISAVEAACQTISGSPKSTLGSCLAKFKSRHTLHPAFEQALLKLYGYSSDSGGIRHCLSEQNTPTFADAKFMLVSCTAFINYLWTLSAETGVKPG